MKLTAFLLCFIVSGYAFAQTGFQARVIDRATQQPLPGVTGVAKGTANGSISDEEGNIVIDGLSDGAHTIIFTFLGFDTLEQEITLPLETQLTISMQPSQSELHEIIIEGTRSNRSIANTPTRVEVLTEEIDEAATMDPSKVAHLLTHSTGIQVQQTSATSNTANVRIQGLDGRYTQILKDGFPLYGGFSGSLSIMQIPPLDLRQVEYIKGSASTLYGAGAIAGLINLISKEPEPNETLIHLNASHIGAMDVNTFFSRKKNKTGFTLLAQRNSHRAFDADDDGYTDMPALVKYNFNPKLFFYFTDKTKLTVGGTYTNEKREGGDLRLLDNDDAAPDSNHFYKETNDVHRLTTQMRFDHQLNAVLTFTARNSFNLFRRELDITPFPASGIYAFRGRQLSSFSEASLSYRHKKNVLVTGLNFYSEDFNEDTTGPNKRDEGYEIASAFGNYTFDINNWISAETGLRADYIHLLDDKLMLLPRAYVLFKWTNKLTSRIGGGMGYRYPTIFNQEAEMRGYIGVQNIRYWPVQQETSAGGSADIGYKTAIGKHYSLNINQMFFMTELTNPLVLVADPINSNVFFFQNASGWTRSYGSETFFKFGFYDFMFFAGYTYTHATNHFSGINSDMTLTPRHSLKGDLLYSLPGKWRIGADYEYKSSQLLSNGSNTPSYWTYGGLVEYTWRKVTLMINVENFTNVRQTKYGTLRSAPYNTPQFTEVWAPLDGIVVNGGIKMRL
ncbi:MAG: TonB-dependent receptor plug [Flavipsychrobacter sp.]|nr:TonB-dependent receptor plug [Flavipsychrobacter sp.]